MGVDIHVWRSLIHAAERGRAGIVGLVGHDTILRIEREPAVGAQIRRRAPGLLDRRDTGETSTGARALAGILIDTRWGLGRRRKAESREFVA